jgi:NitT/TauT family transport system substrate-binding protein
MSLSRRSFVRHVAQGAALPAALTFAPRFARAAQKLRYAFPAPAFLASFTPINLAQIKGYYAQEGLEVEFQSVAGGLEVAKRVAAGEFDLGGGTGDTPILMRPQGIPIKALAVLGGKSLTQIMIRRESNIFSPEAFRGKKISVTSTTDTSYYTLLGFLAAIKVQPEELTIVPSGPVGVFKSLIEGKVDAMAGVPDWVVSVQRSGVKTMIFRSDEFFPSLAQALLSSDSTIARRPEALAAFVRATVKGLAEAVRAPDEAAALIGKTFPQQKGREEELADVIRYFAQNVYPGQRQPGEVNTLRLEKVQNFYRARGIINAATPLRELYATLPSA